MSTSSPEKIPSANRSDARPAARLYLDYFNLKESPFSITPDPEFLYMSSSHRTVIEKILYGINARMGFLLLIGEVGAGKTTLCRTILDELAGKAETAYIINPSLSEVGLIQSILDDLDIEHPQASSKKEMLDLLNRFLLTTSKEKPVVIIIDDAQTMTVEGLETLRLLSNLETDKEKLIQLVLVGQQELLDILSKPEMRQLKQRIAIKCRLELLKEPELQGYISHRLFVAGDKGNIRFSQEAIKKIYRKSLGIPRLVNKICDYTLTAGYVSDSFTLEKNHVTRALHEMEEDQQNGWGYFINLFLSFFQRKNFIRLGITGACVLLLFAYLIFDSPSGTNGSTPDVSAGLSRPASKPQPPVKDSPDVADKNTHDEDVKPSAPAGDAGLKQTPAAHTEKGHNSYILQVASYKSIEDAIRAVSIFNERGLEVSWNAVEGGEQTLYRVYAGRFPSKEAAEDFQRMKGLPEGIIIYAPWTIQSTVFRDKADLADKCQTLKVAGLDCTINGDEESGYRIVSGAFKTQESATIAADKIIKRGIDAKVVFE
jgi:type II secretory pathway predicted ATPase ExeA/cell division protein FtsN